MENQPFTDERHVRERTNSLTSRKGKDKLALIVFAVIAITWAGAGNARRKALSRGQNRVDGGRRKDGGKVTSVR